eukprot:COSAG02_NODE_6276_length_3686_cov_2.296627_2_plen_362_part_00
MDGYVDLSCGGEHTLFVDGSGGLASSGACGFSQHSDLASGPTQQAQWARPCAVRSFVAAVVRQTMPPMRKAVAGYYHSLAISRTGKLFAWGCGNFGTKNDGQLGLGPSKDESLSPREVALPLESGERVVDAAAGCYHSAVLTSHHRVISFGLNNYGQLGRSGISSGPVPRSPAGSAETDTLNNYSDGVPRPVVAAHRTDVDGIGAAFYNIFQLTRDGGMLCAGSNAARQCGSAVAPHDAPSAVPELQDVVLKQATGGYCHTIALAKDGTVFTLGCGEDGQRGDGRPLETDVVRQSSIHMSFVWICRIRDDHCARMWLPSRCRRNYKSSMKMLWQNTSRVTSPPCRWQPRRRRSQRKKTCLD